MMQKGYIVLISVNKYLCSSHYVSGTVQGTECNRQRSVCVLANARPFLKLNVGNCPSVVPWKEIVDWVSEVVSFY